MRDSGLPVPDRGPTTFRGHEYQTSNTKLGANRDYSNVGVRDAFPFENFDWLN